MFLDWLSFTFKISDNKGVLKPAFHYKESLYDGQYELNTIDVLREFKKAFCVLAKWDPMDLDPETKKRGRYIDNPSGIFFNSLIENAVQYKGQLHGYTNVFDLSEGLKMMYHLEHPEMGIHISCSADGLPVLCQALGFNITGDDVEQVDLKSLFRLLRSKHCSPSRIDLTYDDYEKRFTPFDLHECRMNKVSLISSTRKCNIIFDKGVTFYLGDRTSERYLRVYDKFIESKGVIDAVRWELELKGKFAKLIFDLIADGEDISFGMLLQDYMVIKEGSFPRQFNDRGFPIPTDYGRVSRSRAPLDSTFLLLLDEMRADSYQFIRQMRKITYEERKSYQSKCWRKSIQKTILAMSRDEAFSWLMEDVLLIDQSDLEDTISFLNDCPDDIRDNSLYSKYFMRKEDPE